MAHGCGCRRPGCPECGIPEPVYLDAVGAGGRASGMSESEWQTALGMIGRAASSVEASVLAIIDHYVQEVAAAEARIAELEARDPLSGVPAEAREPLAAWLEARRVWDNLNREPADLHESLEELNRAERAMTAADAYRYLPALAAALRGRGAVSARCEFTRKDGSRCGALRDDRAHTHTGYDPTYVQHDYDPSGGQR